MSKVDDKQLDEIAGGSGQFVPEQDGGGGGADGSVEDNAPAPGGSPGLEEEGQSGGSSGVGQG